MIKIINKVKDSNNKMAYECLDLNTNETRTLSKDDIAEQIKSNNIVNARIQVYKGQVIIRVKDDEPKQKSDTPRKRATSTKSKEVYAIDIFKRIIKEFGILHEEEALSVGFDKFELDEEVDTSNKSELASLEYKMAVIIKKIADIENNKRLSEYRKTFENTL
jgi:hypothetical protein